MKKPLYKDVSLAPVWCWGAALLLSFCWLLPNNARPWSSFHSDAWIASLLAIVSLSVLVRGGQVVKLQLAPLVALVLSMLPLLQYGLGTLPLVGQAWISSAYLLGFTLALLTGQHWQKLSPLWMERVLFGAFLFAGTASVYLAMYQWLRLSESADLLDIWVLYFPAERGRPYANLGQPNQLATLFVWALVACVWAVYRKHLQIVGGVCLAGFLLIGLALTQSRSGMVGVLILLFACYLWRRMITQRIFLYCVVGLAIWYVLLLLTLPHLGQSLLLDTEISFVDRSTRESRPYIWRMLLDAATLHPWSGYGWNRVLPAQLAVADTYTRMAGTYLAQSHNLFLDFVVWSGFPMGMLLTGAVLAWVGLAFMRLREASQVLYFLVIVVIGAHAMVELPLHYAYFLLPVGLMAGALNASERIWPWGHISRATALGFWFVVVSLLGLIINDYFRLESAYNDVRFKLANFVKAQNPVIPGAIVLNQLEHAIELYALDPVVGLNAEVVQRAVTTTESLPSAYNISKLVVILALNKQPEAAKSWMQKSKNMMSPENHSNAQKDWARAALQFPQIAATLQAGLPVQAPVAR
ncbi:MAG: Wzy polymerase domain-containing protein [Pseudomonadota bacterium]